MLSEQEYVVQSLELHLFFARIMKEHSIFLEAGFTPKDVDFSQHADELKIDFEDILSRSVVLGNGLIRKNILESGELVTNYTLGAEQKTANFTGIAINSNITRMEANLLSMNNKFVTPQMVMSVKQINRNAMLLLNNIIEFKIRILNEVISCNMFTVNYPLLLKHILREAQLYKKLLMDLENGISLDSLDVKEAELFWDQIMMEHALFIRGLLDPTEDVLIQTSDNFAKSYEQLLKEAKETTDKVIAGVTNDSLEETIRFREFKTAGVKGISECKIKSTILPLLADHVLRESNHFIRILRR
ncbi:MAG: hypothetical protein K0R72_954 [Clostridia bacterium]|jgi:hypothetical protein|nr:hypothetical protein [Clostridia bacterium]